jgi:chromosome segregation ATPase
MKRLNKDQSREKTEHAENIRKKYTELEEALAKYNAAIVEAKGPVEAAVEQLNGAIDDANQWMADITGQMEDYIGERSEKWQEGEAGSNYNEWKDQFAELEQVELELPEELEVPECEHGDTLDNIPDEPGSGF